MNTSAAKISTWSPTDTGGSTSLHEIWQSTIAVQHSAYSLPPGKFHSLLVAPLARVFIATAADTETGADKIVGFSITYLIRSGSASNASLQHYRGGLAVLLVSPEYRNRGVGQGIYDASIAHLEESVKTSYSLSTPTSTASGLQLGSTFPRIFPGVPDSEAFIDAKRWFGKRGWTFGTAPDIDLYQAFPAQGSKEAQALNAKLEELQAKAKSLGFRFGPPGENDLEGLYALQKAEFDTFTGWPDMFPRLVNSGHKDDIHVAWDKDGKIVGATVAAMAPGEGEQEGEIHTSLTWPTTLGKRCGSIACVGVAASTRGSGAGIALVAAATADLIARGADGCFVDWVSLKGFYQKCGYEPWELGYWSSSRTVGV